MGWTGLAFILAVSLLVGCAFWLVARARSDVRRELGWLVHARGLTGEAALSELFGKATARQAEIAAQAVREVRLLCEGIPWSEIAKSTGLPEQQIRADAKAWGLDTEPCRVPSLSWELRQGLIGGAIVFLALVIAAVATGALIEWLEGAFLSTTSGA